MKYATTTPRLVVIAALGVGVATNALAQNGDPPCSFDNSFKAKSIKSPMVRAFVGCGGTTEYPSPNSALGATNTDACAPSIPRSDFTFGEKGSCGFKITASTETNCFPDTAVSSCTNMTFKVKCVDVRDPLGDPIQEDQSLTSGGWRYVQFVRPTLDDRVNGGSHTVIDLPLAFDFPPANRGKLKLTASSNEALVELLGVGGSFPPCASLETPNSVIVDPSIEEGVFARPGVGSGGGN